MKRPYKVGMKIKGVCNSCKKVVSATFKKGSLDSHGILVPNVLLLICDECGKMVGFPGQTIHDIVKYRAKYEGELGEAKRILKLLIETNIANLETRNNFVRCFTHKNIPMSWGIAMKFMGYKVYQSKKKATE